LSTNGRDLRLCCYPVEDSLNLRPRGDKAEESPGPVVRFSLIRARRLYCRRHKLFMPLKPIRCNFTTDKVSYHSRFGFEEATPSGLIALVAVVRLIIISFVWFLVWFLRAPHFSTPTSGSRFIVREKPRFAARKLPADVNKYRRWSIKESGLANAAGSRCGFSKFPPEFL
jgi:hypothetical protein